MTSSYVQFGVVSQLADLYKVAETDTLINFFSKMAIRSCRDTSPQKLKEGIINRFSHLLAIYRKHCADPSSHGQLILPERLKVMPAYMSSVICDDSIFPHCDIPTDERSFLRQKVLQMTVENSNAYFYPSIYPIINSAINPNDPKPGIRCSIERFKQDQIYVVENGLVMYIWIGPQVQHCDIQSIWGVNSPLEVLDGPIPIKDSENNSTIRTLITTINQKRGKSPKQIIIRGGHPDAKIAESRMRRLMVEDNTGPGTTSYVDFLIHVHREIRQLLS
jgi:protein transport protein SEC24